MKRAVANWLRRARASFPLTREAYRRLPAHRLEEIKRQAARDLRKAVDRDSRIEAAFAVAEIDAALKESQH